MEESPAVSTGPFQVLSVRAMGSQGQKQGHHSRHSVLEGTLVCIPSLEAHGEPWGVGRGSCPLVSDKRCLGIPGGKHVCGSFSSLQWGICREKRREDKNWGGARDREEKKERLGGVDPRQLPEPLPPQHRTPDWPRPVIRPPLPKTSAGTKGVPGQPPREWMVSIGS
jgi:hypothetical protein